MTSRSHRQQKVFDWVLFCIYLALVGIGLLMLYATGDDFNKEEADFWTTDIGKQVIWAAISMVVCLLISLIDWKFWLTFAYPIYAIGIISLIALLIFGTEVKGARSWFAFSGFSIQPSELVKITTIVGLAAFCSSYKTNLSNRLDQVVVFSIMLLPSFLVFLQPDAGSALTFFACTFLLLRKGLPVRYLLFGLSLLAAVILSIVFSPYMAFSVIITLSLFFVLRFTRTDVLSHLILLSFVLLVVTGYRFDFLPLAALVQALSFLVIVLVNTKRSIFNAQWGTISAIVFIGLFSLGISHTYENILRPHQKDRINVWLKPKESDPRGSLYNLMQSKMAIGSGGLHGKGFLKGTMTRLNYVPEQKTDFIFSTIGEEQGFVGSLGTILLFFVFLVRILSIGEGAQSEFILYFAYGVAGLIFFHVFINIGMTIGVAPVIGIPLPFMSKGGSSLLAFSTMVGILLNMRKARK